MSLFRRRRATDEAEAVSNAEATESATSESSETAAAQNAMDAEAPIGLSPRPQGPWDDSERPDRDGYIDLGGLRLRGREGMELRLEMEEATGSVTGATIQLGQSAVQVQAFAAPRTEGIWAEIRSEIATGITQQGGTVEEVTGVFGPELLARIPARSADGRTGHQPARFAGIDGPRWFLRAVFHGQAVKDHEAAADLESVIRDIVVVRGEEAMAPRDLLVLQLPKAVADALQESAEESVSDDFNPFERGPEITEVR